MSATTATVQALTAEVRVLMVGNRQITLSVARQLDFVQLDRLDVWGRVRLGGTWQTPESGVVIGRDMDGDLSLARYRHSMPIDPEEPTYISEEDIGGPVLVCDRHRATVTSHGEVELTYPMGKRGVPIVIQEEMWKRCGDHGFTSHRVKDAPHCPKPFDANGNETGISAAVLDHWDRWSTGYERNRAAKNAPLIILAGLK